jgi:glucose/arabinose dehydrogenase
MAFRSFGVLLFLSVATICLGDEPFIPRKQTQPPGPPLSPAEAIKKMTVPEGFSVELVASEPDIVNPVAMTFDEQGRVWITESFEYPRREPGPGRDRVKVLEDTDGDGKADKFTVFAEGLNIPSGIAVGYGGVWVANSPDILFLQDTDGDGKSDKQEVVVTGFGRADTHELPNSLTWGPDGYLYGLNGVFNPSHVVQDGRKFDFTCALFRIHPRTRKFELFAEGTSNPWGVAWDPEGSAFLSACVIDHLWHLTETGYYLRQGGPYPPFTWHIGSIVKHSHQLAAYCGIHYFDSEAYPKEYRDRLYMGNIHGGCINVDTLKRNGSTYMAEAAPDFLTANDVWFMPVVQKTGPDGCLYILDWYDRYHCYQDANADPKGIDRGHGRLYRVRYEGVPRAPRFDLAKETDDELLARLKSPNVFFRDLAQRVLTERNSAATRAKLESFVLDDQAPRKSRMHALWTLVGSGSLSTEFHSELLNHQDAALRSWGVRAAGNFRKVDEALRMKVVSMTRDPAPDVQLQVAIAARKLEGVQPIPVLVDVLAHSGNDPLIPYIVWQNLHPLLGEQSAAFIAEVKKHDLAKSPNLKLIMPKATERMLAAKRK